MWGVGHVAPSREADLWAAVLHAGPGAAVSHATAAHWRDLADFPGPVIHVSTPRACASLPGIAVHGRRTQIDREIVDRLPVTTVAQTVLDVAASTSDLKLVRKLLAEIEYRTGTLDAGRLRVVCGRGRRGSVRLAEALDAYDPRLAHTHGRLELGFYVFCEQRIQRGVPLPECNVEVAGVTGRWSRTSPTEWNVTCSPRSPVGRSSCGGEARDRAAPEPQRARSLVECDERNREG